MDKKLCAPGGTVTFRATHLADWDGTRLARRALALVQRGCVVRVVVSSTPQTGGWECVYVAVEKVKDGSVWGVVQNTYRPDDSAHVPTGAMHKFRLTDIIEFPVSWQPKRVQKALAAMRR